jgi:hypothetical protein
MTGDALPNCLSIVISEIHRTTQLVVTFCCTTMGVNRTRRWCSHNHSYNGTKEFWYQDHKSLEHYITRDDNLPVIQGLPTFPPTTKRSRDKGKVCINDGRCTCRRQQRLPSSLGTLILQKAGADALQSDSSDNSSTAGVVDPWSARARSIVCGECSDGLRDELCFRDLHRPGIVRLPCTRSTISRLVDQVHVSFWRATRDKSLLVLKVLPLGSWPSNGITAIFC